MEDATSDSTSLIVADFKPSKSQDFLSRVMATLQQPALRKKNFNLPLIRPFWHVRVSQNFGRRQLSKHRFDLLLVAQEKGGAYAWRKNSTGLQRLISNTSLSHCTPSDVLAEETVLNSSVDLAVSKATLATDVSKESYLVKLSLEGVPSKPLIHEDIPKISLEPERISDYWTYIEHYHICFMEAMDEYGPTNWKQDGCWDVRDILDEE